MFYGLEYYVCKVIFFQNKNMLKIVTTTTKSSNQVTISFSVCTHQVVYHAGHPSQGSRTPRITHLSWGGGPLHLGVGSHQGKHSSQVLDGTTLPPQRRDRQISFSSELWSPVASSLSWWPTQGDWPMLTTVLLRWNEPWSFLWSLKYWKLAVCLRATDIQA